MDPRAFILTLVFSLAFLASASPLEKCQEEECRAAAAATALLQSKTAARSASAAVEEEEASPGVRARPPAALPGPSSLLDAGITGGRRALSSWGAPGSGLAANDQSIALNQQKAAEVSA
mmetsp:Transcript_15779/g.46094  ORF Transcript_15779/g.46094 Transcript_15779/m.46094 type:complete len:119 (-) Transcript_15779:138-494(-)